MSQKPEDFRAFMPPVRDVSKLRLALFQPEIAPNVGAALRLVACLGVELELIEPLGFVYHPARVRRSALDYGSKAKVALHPSFDAFLARQQGEKRRVVLLTTRAATAYTEVAYRPDDVLLLGQESAGVPGEVHEAADLAVVVPMVAGMRSLNLVTAAAMVLGEALRQTEAAAAD